VLASSQYFLTPGFQPEQKKLFGFQKRGTRTLPHKPALHSCTSGAAGSRTFDGYWLEASTSVLNKLLYLKRVAMQLL